jgi:very-short-patch-repair endonuclease
MSLKNPHKQGGMFEGANYLLFENAKELRNNKTVAETAKDDKTRQQQLNDWGYEVVRFSIEQVLTQIETVLETISKTIGKKFIIQQQNASSKEGV